MAAEMPRARRVTLSYLSWLAASTLALGIAGCAPEPGSDVPPPEEIAGAGKEGLAEGEPRPAPDPEAFEKTTELPPGFPSDLFALPEGSTVDDVGERSSDSWFIVLRANSGSDADALWAAVIAQNGLQSTEDGGEGELIVLEGASLRVEALRVPDGDQELLSYDLTRTVG